MIFVAWGPGKYWRSALNHQQNATRKNPATHSRIKGKADGDPLGSELRALLGKG